MARRDLTALGRTLSNAQLELDAEGWTPVEALLAALRGERNDGPTSSPRTSPR